MNFHDITKYDRRNLAELIALFPHEIVPHTNGDTKATRWYIELLERKCRMERERGINGHWTYDVPRHARMCAALEIERRILKMQEAGMVRK